MDTSRRAIVKRAGTQALAALLCLAAAGLAVEGYARWKHGSYLAFKAHQLAFRNADMTFHNILIPNATGRSVTSEWDVPYAINPWGLRDREYALPKPPGTFRILAVGDSRVEGYGVRLEEAFVKRLEQALNEAGRARNSPVAYEVVNGGIAGYSPLLEYLFVSRRGLQLEPDLVVVFYTFNDLVDDFEREQTAVFDANGVPLACPPHKRVRIHSRHPLERWLIRHSRAYLYLEHKLNSFLYKRWYPHQARIREMDVIVPFRGPAEVIDELWERNRRSLALIHQLLQERGISMVLVSYPDAVEIDPNEWAEGRTLHAFAIGTVVDQPRVVSHLEAFAKARGIPFINLYDDVKASRLRPLYFQRDGHPTTQGHRVFAEGLFRHLTARGSPTAHLFR